MKMTSTVLVFSFVILVLPCVTCFDITKLLSQYPAYSSFSNYLTQTQLANEVNTKQTVTVLAVDNAGMAPISGKPMDVIRNLLSIHVILDYFDAQKFQHLHNQTITVTTLFQATGEAQGMQGFMKVADLSTGAVTFVSGADSNGSGANFIKAVVSQPYTISVVQVSNIIMPPALLAYSNTASPSPAAKSTVPVVSPMPVTTLVPVPVLTPVPVITPVPVVSPVPVLTPVPVITPVPVVSPVPVLTPVPVITPVPVVSPVPVATPGPAPVNPPAPEISPVPAAPVVPVLVPVVSPVPVATPVPVPVPVPVESPSGGGASDGSPGDSGPSSDGGNGDGGNGDGGDGDGSSGVEQFSARRGLALLLTLSSMYVLSTPTFHV